MDNKAQQTKTTEEIDLFEIFNRIGNGFKNLFNKILLLLKLFIVLSMQKILWIIIFCVLGLLVSFFLYNNTARYYSYEMVARSNAIDNNAIIYATNNLNNLFENADYEEISIALGLSIDDIKKIKSIKAYYGIDLNKDTMIDFVDYKNTFNPKDTLQNRIFDIFYLQVSVFDKSIFSDLRKGIKDFVNKNPYIIHNNEVRKEQIKQLIKEYNYEIKILDSLQKIQYFEVPKIQKSGNSQILVLNEKESKLYHEEIIYLITKKLELEKELSINPDPITIIQDFTQLTNPNIDLLQHIKYWVPLFSFLGLFLSLAWQNRVAILKAIRQK